MYSRYPNYRFSGGVKIPDNYSGNAFKQVQTEPETEEISAAQVSEERETENDTLPIQENEGAVPSAVSARRPLLGGLKFNFGRIFSGGIGFEEILIIGMILLLMQDNSDDDIILLLLLILFAC